MIGTPALTRWATLWRPCGAEPPERLKKEAIEFHLEGLREDRLPIPEATTHRATIEPGLTAYER